MRQPCPKEKLARGAMRPPRKFPCPSLSAERAWNSEGNSHKIALRLHHRPLLETFYVIRSVLGLHGWITRAMVHRFDGIRWNPWMTKLSWITQNASHPCHLDSPPWHTHGFHGSHGIQEKIPMLPRFRWSPDGPDPMDSME